MASFPLTNFHDLNEETWPEVLSGINASIEAAQPKTLETPITIGGTDYETVEAALQAIATALAG